jgi:hypothetical protein
MFETFLPIALTEVFCFTASILGLVFSLAWKHLSVGLTVAAWGFVFLLAGLVTFVVLIVVGVFPIDGLLQIWVVYNLFRVFFLAVVVVGSGLAFQDIGTRLAQQRRSGAGNQAENEEGGYFVLPAQEKITPWQPIRENENGVQT